MDAFHPSLNFKKVGRDCKVCKSSVSATEEEITRGELSVAQHKLVNRKAEIMSSIGNQEVVQKQLIIVPVQEEALSPS